MRAVTGLLSTQPPTRHAKTHRPGNSDALPTAAPSNPTGTAASEGSAASFMRSDATIEQGIVSAFGDILTHNVTIPAAHPMPDAAFGQPLSADEGSPTGLRWGPTVLSPAQITSNQNDYDPGQPGVWRLSTDASRDITGILAQSDGMRLVVYNVGAFNVVLKHQNAGSAAENRIICAGAGAVDITLAPNDSAEMYYDDTTERWRAFQS
jgi:hypothetical protein